MENQGREYRYQKDWSIGGEMYHVRCDSWQEFQDAVKNIENTYVDITKAINKPVANTPPRSATPVNIDSTTPVCTVCGAPLLPEKRIISKKDGRPWWVRSCPSGEYSHKGLIRAAK